MTTEQYIQADHQDAVFKEMYIPRTLQEVSMEDIVRMQRDGVEIAFDKLTGLKLDKEQAEKNVLERMLKLKAGVNDQEKKEEIVEAAEEKKDVDDSGDEESSEDEINQDDYDDETGERKDPTVNLDNMTKEERKAHKKKVKEENREKRQSKVPKFEKKQMQKKYKKH